MGFFGVFYSQKVRKKIAWQNGMKIFLKNLPKTLLYVNMNVPKKI
jgi:hypothetical protein